jgi:hypothetical protein
MAAAGQIVFATMTLARTASEADLLVRALAALSTFGQPIVVADGGSEPQFIDRIAGVPHCQLRTPASGGLVSQIRSALEGALAAGRPIICYTEPDKLEFFKSGLAAFLAAIDADRSFGVALAARMPAAFATFPRFQQYAERAINDLVGDVTGVAGDYSYGPFAMDPEVARLVTALDADVGWGWRHYASVAAHHLGRTVALHPGDHVCPPDQRDDDAAERLHRLRQLEQNSRGLLLALTSRARD